MLRRITEPIAPARLITSGSGSGSLLLRFFCLGSLDLCLRLDLCLDFFLLALAFSSLSVSGPLLLSDDSAARGALCGEMRGSERMGEQ